MKHNHRELRVASTATPFTCDSLLATLVHVGTSMSGVDLVFDMAIDQGAWPGPLDDKDGAFGELWVGPQGLLAFLETGLGLCAKSASAAEREVVLAAQLESRSGFWRASYEADPIATSKRLLRDRDLLILQGWEGQELSARLTAMWEATLEAPIGAADRLLAVCKALGSRQVDVASLRLYSARATLPPLWRQVVSALETQGATISEAPTPNSSAPDGTRIELLRPHGPLAAAEEITASLARLESLQGVVVIGGDSMLDEALVRHGLPRLGLPTSRPASHELVQLVLETAFSPMDPQSLHALICMEPGPIPRVVARRLVRALRSTPGRTGPEWVRERQKGLSHLHEDRRESTSKRMDALLMPIAAQGEGLTQAQLEARLHNLTRWARGRSEAEPDLAWVLGHCQRVLSLARDHASESFDRSLLLELCEKTKGSPNTPTGEVGLTAIADPAAILGPASTIVWWNFTRASAPTPQRLRLTGKERLALAHEGVEAPDFAASMTHQAEHWARPLIHATTLVLACPEVDDAGGTSYPHPLWDELSTTMSGDERSQATTRMLRLPAEVERTRYSRSSLPKPCDEIRTKHRLPLREEESPSSLKGLIGCSLKWALRYHGHMRPGVSGGPGEPSPLLYGTVAHYLLAEVFGDGALDGEAAALKAQALVDRELVQLCEALGLPRYQDEQGIVRRAIVESARRLGELLSESGARVGSVEEEVTGQFGSLKLKGRADLIIRDPDVVIDLKWGAWSNRKALKSGTSLQLAAYAHAAQEGEELPSVAYFVLKEQILLTEPGCPLPNSETPGNTAASETWRLAMLTLERKREELADGRLYAPGATADEVESRVMDDSLVMDPECGFCDLGAICGRSSAQ